MLMFLLFWLLVVVGLLIGIRWLIRRLPMKETGNPKLGGAIFIAVSVFLLFQEDTVYSICRGNATCAWWADTLAVHDHPILYLVAVVGGLACGIYLLVKDSSSGGYLAKDKRVFSGSDSNDKDAQSYHQNSAIRRRSFCSQCGGELHEEDKFCAHCGAQVSRV